jgi:hypothetical protein
MDCDTTNYTSTLPLPSENPGLYLNEMAVCHHPRPWIQAVAFGEAWLPNAV